MDNLDRLISVIVYADIVGYTSMMQKNEQQALSKLKYFEGNYSGGNIANNK